LIGSQGQYVIYGSQGGITYHQIKTIDILFDSQNVKDMAQYRIE